MSDNEISTFLREDLFPGNTKAFQLLGKELAAGNLTAFVGAGASSPLVPTWSQALKILIDETLDNGKIESADRDYLIKRVLSNPLDVAGEIENIVGVNQFRARLSDLFEGKHGNFTPCNEIIIDIPLKGIITTNYDACLTAAYVYKRQCLPKVYVSDLDEHLVQWNDSRSNRTESTPILHLHGVRDRAKSIIFTKTDYNNFYIEGKGSTFLSDVWKSSRLLVIGFGFSDPFLDIFAPASVNQLNILNRHFAFIGSDRDTKVSLLQRTSFENNYRLTPIFYKINIDDENREDHSALLHLLGSIVLGTKGKDDSSISKIIKFAPQKNVLRDATAKQSATEYFKQDFESNLLGRPGRILYVQPRLMDRPHRHDCIDKEASQLSITAIANSDCSYLIHTPAEAGGTTLAKRLAYEISLAGGNVTLKDATTLPKYKNKLLKEFSEIISARNSVLILDDFILDEHDRLLKEIISLGIFSRLIFICRSSHFDVSTHASLSEIKDKITFNHVYLWTLGRSDVRDLASNLVDAGDESIISEYVDKVYRDLLSLCIPLTPANVLMYLKILGNEYNFQPLNRVQIIERYITELLRSSDEMFNSAFSSKNKIELVGAFVHHLYSANSGSFSHLDWLEFSKEYCEKNLVEFDGQKLINELTESRVITIFKERYYFKYRFFYLFFLCKHLTSRPKIIDEFIDSERYLDLSDSVEIISSLSADNTKLTTKLCDQLEGCINQFAAEFLPKSFDPLRGMRWPRSDKDKEIERVWQPVAEILEKGPAKHSEIDNVKSCLEAEVATEDQRVSFDRFDRLERRLVAYHARVRQALVGSDELDGGLKLRAVKALMQSYFTFLQVSFVLTPALMKVRYFNWFGLLFINNAPAEKENPSPYEQLQFAFSWLPGIGARMKETVGTKKLGPVFRRLLRDEDVEGFANYLNLQCLIRSKPTGWQDDTQRVINQTEKDSIYLLHILNALIDEWRNEVNTTKAQYEMKLLITRVYVKRGIGKMVPSMTDVTRAIERLEKKGIFDNLASENIAPHIEVNDDSIIDKTA